MKSWISQFDKQGVSQTQVLRRLKRLSKKLGFNPFSDILYCPVCSQDKPSSDWLVREVFHIQTHLRAIALFLIEYGEFPTYEFNREYRKMPVWCTDRMVYDLHGKATAP